MGLLAELVAAVGGWITAAMNAITDVFLTPPLQATLEHLEETDLKTLSGGESVSCVCSHETVSIDATSLIYLLKPCLETKTFKAKALWEKSGAVVMAVRRPG